MFSLPEKAADSWKRYIVRTTVVLVVVLLYLFNRDTACLSVSYLRHMHVAAS